MLRRINDAAALFFVPLEVAETYQKIVEQAKLLVNAAHGSVILWQNNELNRIYTSEPILNRVKPRKKGRTYEAFYKKKASIHYVQEKDEPHPTLRSLNIKTVVYIPLSYYGVKTGVINMLCPDHQTYTDEELDLLELFGTFASLAIRKAQSYSEARNLFENQKLYLSLASHELKTPLTALYTFVQLFEDNAKNLDNRSDKLFQRIKDETVRINVLVDEFLDPHNTELDTNGYKWKACNFKELVKRAIADFKTIFPAHDVIIRDNTKSQYLFVWGDENKLLQVINNLLNNAGKYSFSGSRITFLIDVSEDSLRCAIKDRGKGIPQSELKSVFSKFYRGKDQKKMGMGLGLYLVKKIIDAHSGTISVYSKIDSGTIFRISLPIYNHDGKTTGRRFNVRNQEPGPIPSNSSI